MLYIKTIPKRGIQLYVDLLSRKWKKIWNGLLFIAYYVEAFLDMKQKSWIIAHVHMYEFFGGVAKILVPDNCKTAVVHNNS